MTVGFCIFAQHLKGVLRKIKSKAEIIPNEPERVMPLREKQVETL